MADYLDCVTDRFLDALEACDKAEIDAVLLLARDDERLAGELLDSLREWLRLARGYRWRWN